MARPLGVGEGAPDVVKFVATCRVSSCILFAFLSRQRHYGGGGGAQMAATVGSRSSLEVLSLDILGVMVG